MRGCGGALISPDTVLFAAHCAGNMTDTQVSIGAYKQKSIEGGAVGGFCEEVVTDPMFGTESSINYDFALCKLDSPVAIDENRVKLVLNKDNDFPSDGDDLLAMGFGSLEYGNDQKPEYLQDVTVKYITNDDCNAENRYKGMIKDAMLCAGDLDVGGKDSCTGDSGGPLVRRIKNQDGTFTDIHVGVVTGGNGCGQKDKPGIYARISKRADWIMDTMCNQFNSVAAVCNNPVPGRSKCDGRNLTVSVTTDVFGFETSWSLYDSSRNIVKKRKYLISDLKADTTVCLKSDESYEWEIQDQFGDGLCTDENPCGSYELMLDGKVIIKGDGNFTFNKTELITVCEDIKRFRYKGKKKGACRRFLRGTKKSVIEKCNRKFKGKRYKNYWCRETCSKKLLREGRCFASGRRQKE